MVASGVWVWGWIWAGMGIGSGDGVWEGGRSSGLVDEQLWKGTGWRCRRWRGRIAAVGLALAFEHDSLDPKP